MENLVKVCKKIFGYGIMIVLFAGGFTFFAYVAALVIGGDTAAAICNWTYNSFTPIVILVSTIMILFGLLTMYLSGEKALVPGRKNTHHEGER